jgi:nucleotide-binding universal stress UspA family protein
MSDGPDRERVIVVAYDGSPSSLVALRRAAEHAADGGRVIVVHAYEAPMGALRPSDYPGHLEEAKERGQALLDALPTEALGNVKIEKQLLSGPTARLVANVASDRGAEEIIMGTRGFGRGRAALGSVAHEVIHLAECPVTVIPERAVREQTAT